MSQDIGDGRTYNLWVRLLRFWGFGREPGCWDGRESADFTVLDRIMPNSA